MRRSISGTSPIDRVVPAWYLGFMNTTERFWATIEYTGNGRAIIELTNSRGEWSGAGRISVRSGLRADLYEAGYREASARAACKGGILDRFTEVA